MMGLLGLSTYFGRRVGSGDVVSTRGGYEGVPCDACSIYKGSCFFLPIMSDWRAWAPFSYEGLLHGHMLLPGHGEGEGGAYFFLRLVAQNLRRSHP